MLNESQSPKLIAPVAGRRSNGIINNVSELREATGSPLIMKDASLKQTLNRVIGGRPFESRTVKSSCADMQSDQADA